MHEQELLVSDWSGRASRQPPIPESRATHGDYARDFVTNGHFRFSAFDERQNPRTSPAKESIRSRETLGEALSQGA